MHRRREAERLGFRRDVVDDAVGDQDGAADALRRNVGEAGRKRRTARVPSVSPCDWPASIIRTSRFVDAAEPLGQRRAHGFGLLAAVRRGSGSGAVDDDRDDARQRIAVLAGQRRIGERERHEGKRHGAHQRPRPHREQEQRHRDRHADRRPSTAAGTSGANEIPNPIGTPTGRAARAAPARAPGRPCSCRSGCT